MNKHCKMVIDRKSVISISILAACVICNLLSCSSRMKPICIPFVEYADIQLEASCIATVTRYERSDGETDWGMPKSVDTISYTIVRKLLHFPIDTCNKQEDGKLYLSGFYVNRGRIEILMSVDKNEIDSICAWIEFVQKEIPYYSWVTNKRLILHNMKRSDPPNDLILSLPAEDVYHYAEKASIILEKNSIFILDSTHYTYKKLPDNKLFAYKKEYVTPVRMLLDSNSYVRVILYNRNWSAKTRGIMENMSVNSD